MRFSTTCRTGRWSHEAARTSGEAHLSATICLLPHRLARPDKKHRQQRNDATTTKRAEHVCCIFLFHCIIPYFGLYSGSGAAGRRFSQRPRFPST